ncbi:hypothetical protein [Microlunatus ginsengisoli]
MSGRTSGPAAWSSLPPVQRSLGDVAPAVAPPDAFRSSLTTQQNPSFLGPLGHLVDPDGPSGVVGGLADAAPGQPLSYGGGPELRVPEAAPAKRPAPAVQRHIATLRPEPSSEPSSTPAADVPVEVPIAAAPMEHIEGPAPTSSAAVESVSPAQPSAPLTVARRADPAAVDPAAVDPAAVDPAGTHQAATRDPAGGDPGFGDDRAAASPVPSALPIQRLADDGGGSGPEATSAEVAVPPSPTELPTLGEPAAAPGGAGSEPVPTQPSLAPSSTTPSGTPAGTTPAGTTPAGTTPALIVPVQRSTAAGEVGGAGQLRTYGPGPSLADSARPVASAPASREPVAGDGQPSRDTRTLSGDPGPLTVSRSADPTAPGATPPSQVPVSPPAAPAGTDLVVARESAGHVSGSSGPSDAIPPTTIQRLAAVSEPVAEATPEPSGAPSSSAPEAGPDDPAVPTWAAEQGATGAAAASAGDAPQPTDVVGLLASRPPLAGASGADGDAHAPAIGGTDSMPVATGRTGPGSPAVQRQFAEPSRPTAGSSHEPSPVDVGPAPDPSASPSTVASTSSAPTLSAAAPVRIPVEGGSPADGRTDAVAPVDQEYPPLVQRRSTTTEHAAPAEAPLSGFAAAITALQAEPDGSVPMSGTPGATPAESRSHAPHAGPELVVARQAAESAAVPLGQPAARTNGPSAGPGEPSRPTASDRPPALVVARRLAPDASGSLPAADVRLGLLRQPAVVQRTLLTDRAPLVRPEPAAWAQPAGATEPPVQRVRYEDHTAARHAPATSEVVAATHGWTAAEPSTEWPSSSPAEDRTWSPLPAASGGPAAVQRSMSWAAPTPGSLPSGLPASGSRDMGVAGPSYGPSPASWTSSGPSTLPGGGPSTFPGPSAPAVLPDPAGPPTPEPFVQLLAEPRPAATQPTAESTRASSSRTVGLAEMFALVAGTPGDESDAAGAMPAVQRDVAAAPAPAATEVQLAEAAPASAAAPAGGAAAPGGPASGSDIEEMARRLYEPLSARLRAELWQDRERAGLLTDLRP